MQVHFLSRLRLLTADATAASLRANGSPTPAPSVALTLRDNASIATVGSGHMAQVRLLDRGDDQAADLQGVAMLWRRRSHRVSVANVSVDQQSQTASPSVAVRMVGGTWSTGKAASDDNDVTVRTAAVTMPGALAVPGEIVVMGLGRRQGDQASAVATGTVSVPLTQVAPGSAVAVTLNGFGIDTNPSHPEGTTIGGLRARLTNPRQVGDALQFDYEIGIEGHATPDRRLQHLDNGLLADLRLGFTAWVVPNGAVTTRRMETQAVRRASAHAGPTSLPTAAQSVSVQGQPGLAGGHLGVSGFAIDFDTSGRLAGRYMRGFQFGIAQTGYDPTSGRVSGLATTGYTNTGEVARRTRYHLDLDTVLIQSPNPVQRQEQVVHATGMPH